MRNIAKRSAAALALTTGMVAISVAPAMAATTSTAAAGDSGIVASLIAAVSALLHALLGGI